MSRLLNLEGNDHQMWRRKTDGSQVYLLLAATSSVCCAWSFFPKLYRDEEIISALRHFSL